MDIEVTEVVPGEFDVAAEDGTRCRVLIPAGVGPAGADEAELAGALIRLLRERGRSVPAVIDASRLFVADPGLFVAVEAALGLDDRSMRDP